MVFYLEKLRVNCESFREVAGWLRELMDLYGYEYSGFEESMANTDENLAIIDELLAAGITELEVPQKTC